MAPIVYNFCCKISLTLELEKKSFKTVSPFTDYLYILIYEAQEQQNYCIRHFNEPKNHRLALAGQH